ncbi:catalase family peroxidase [Azotobacter vinelandii]|uniref:catalase family peroxidase n=1 Tax=Azotobacter vinelandii TaxID=354 RepID=UPI0007748C4C|nr:catalase family peroxidase [Azotobacter vinelandii]WKN21690.1 catalase family peroxidase [Azotobacter vinelandii]
MKTQNKDLPGWLLAAGLGLAAPFGMAAQDEVTPAQVVAALEDTFGVTPGERRNHIKGTCASGEFVGLPAVAAWSRSALFSGQPVPVVARFSLPGGNPKVPDTARSVRGMALEFRLPGGALQHMTMLDTPVFGAAQPKTFLDQILALKPDPATGKPDPAKLAAFRASHPDSRAQARFLAEHNPPPSFANSSYFGIHTFKFVDATGKATLVRWRFVPEDGEKSLSDEELETLPADFLEERLIQRTAQGPVRWDMLVSIGQPGDPENDPTVAWPENREQVKAGTLVLTAAMPQKGAACEKVNFDPLVMAEGIAPTDDPILRFRSPAYAVSFAKRQAGQ